MTQFLTRYFPNVIEIQEEVIESTFQTIYMVLVTAAVAGILGILLGVVLVVTSPNGILENKRIYNFLDQFVNIFRSLPFIIMMALIVPFTRLLVGTSIGTSAAIVPLVVGTTPFFARQIQNALLEVDEGIIEAAQAMGSTPLEIIFRVYLKEGLIPIIR